MGTLARQNSLVFQIQLQQKIHSVLYCCSNIYIHHREPLHLVTTYLSVTERVPIKSFPTVSISIITFSERTSNHWSITSTYLTESSPHKKFSCSTKEQSLSDQTLTLGTESGSSTLSFTPKNNSTEESDFSQMAHGLISTLLTQSSTRIWEEPQKNSDWLQQNSKHSSTTKVTSWALQLMQAHSGLRSSEKNTNESCLFNLIQSNQS